MSCNGRPHGDVRLAVRAMDGYAFGGMLSRCRTAACGQKKIASDFVSAGGLQPPSTEGLTRSRVTLPRTYRSSKEGFDDDRAPASSFVVCLVHLVSLLYPVSLVQPNKQEKPNTPEHPAGPHASRVSRTPQAQSARTGVLRARDGTAPPWGEPVRRSLDSGASWLPYGSRRRRKCVHLA